VSARQPRWSRWSDEELLALPFSALRLSIEGTPVEAHVARLFAELERRGLGFRPHVWLSSDFFSPDGVPGVALPFYLAHPRLVRLERAQVLWAEGAAERECMRLLRHEAGHAVDTAFALHRRRAYRETFGRRGLPYRRHYAVDPASRAFVRYLPRWYAQSHPAEDFAETFAAWLDPGSRWRSRYAGWEARAKVELVDRWMRGLAGERPRVRRRERSYSLASLRETLGRHYARKRRRLAAEPAAPYERVLVEGFERPPAATRRSPAAAHLAQRRRAVAARVRGPFRADRYAIEQVIDGLIHRARELGLRLQPGGRAPTLRRLAGTIEDTLAELQRGNHRLCR